MWGGLHSASSCPVAVQAAQFAGAQFDAAIGCEVLNGGASLLEVLAIAANGGGGAAGRLADFVVRSAAGNEGQNHVEFALGGTAGLAEVAVGAQQVFDVL